MSFTSASPLSQDDACALHCRLLAGDPVAPSDLAMAYLEHLAGWLVRRHPGIEDSSCWEAAEEAIIALSKQPEAYQPERGTLDNYLRMSASGDLKNLLRAERRHRERRADWGAVELSPAQGKYLQDQGSDPARIVELQEMVMERLADRARVTQAMAEGLTPEEARVLALMQEKERKTAVYAAALGIAHLPLQEQRVAVKRVKDRLTKRIERSGVGHG
jgi:RNA polymerase sigma-70 factor (ECF subfamily)